MSELSPQLKDAATKLVDSQEQMIRRIVREEIAAVLGSIDAAPSNDLS